MCRKDTKGFTLLELLLVVGLIVLLTGILLPALARGRAMTYQAVCASNLRQVFGAFSMYLGDYGQTYPAKNDRDGTVWLWMGRGWRPVVAPYLGDAVSGDAPSVLWCPADGSKAYDSTSYAYSMSFYHSVDQINAMTDVSATYTGAVPAVGVRPHQVTWPAEKIFVGEWFSNHQRVNGTDPGWWGFSGGRNFIFADGHVDFLAAEAITPANDGLPDPNLTVDGCQGRDR